jgi:flagellar basal body-associated protein FliL
MSNSGNLHNTTNHGNRSTSLQVFAGTVEQRPIVAAAPQPSRKGRGLIFLIVFMVIAAITTVLVTLATVKKAKDKAERQAAFTALFNMNVDGATNLWLAQMEPIHQQVSTQTRELTRRVNKIINDSKQLESASANALRNDITRFVNRVDALTNGLSACHTYAVGQYEKAKVATSIEEASNTKKRMEKTFDTLKQYQESIPNYETTLAALEARVRNSGRPTEQPASALTVHKPAPTTHTSQPEQVAKAEARLKELEQELNEAMLSQNFGPTERKLKDLDRKWLEEGIPHDLIRKALVLGSQSKLLLELQISMLASLNRNPPRIQFPTTKDVTKPEYTTLYIKGKQVGWKEITPQEVMNLHQQTIDATTSRDQKARRQLAAAIYAQFHGNKEAAAKLRADAIASDKNIASLAARTMD